MGVIVESREKVENRVDGRREALMVSFTPAEASYRPLNPFPSLFYPTHPPVSFELIRSAGRGRVFDTTKCSPDNADV